MSIYNIKTVAGKALWQKINQEHGSAVWGAVGNGIEAIEAEVEARIIKLLEDFANKEWDRLRHPYSKIMLTEDYAYYDGLLEAVEQIKKEK